MKTCGKEVGPGALIAEGSIRRLLFPRYDRRLVERDDAKSHSLRCFNCRQLLFVITRQVGSEWKRLNDTVLSAPTIDTLSKIFKDITIQSSLALVNLDGRCRRCNTSMNELRTEAFNRSVKYYKENGEKIQMFRKKLPKTFMVGDQSNLKIMNDTKKMLMLPRSTDVVNGTSDEVNYHHRRHRDHQVRSSSTLHDVTDNCHEQQQPTMEDFVLSCWKPRLTTTTIMVKQQLASGNGSLANNNNHLWNGPLGGYSGSKDNTRQTLQQVYQTFVGQTVFPTKAHLQQPPTSSNNFGNQNTVRSSVIPPPAQQIVNSMDHSRYPNLLLHTTQNTAKAALMAHQRSMQTASASSSSAQSPHKRSTTTGHKHHQSLQCGNQQTGTTTTAIKTGAKGLLRSNNVRDGSSSPAPTVQQTFPTNFSRILKESPPPVPPALLRSQSTPLVRKDPASRLKVLLRVLPSVAGGSNSPDNSYLTVDGRKKQVALIEQQTSLHRPTVGANGSAKTNAPKIFSFDSVFCADDSQTEICSHALTEVAQSVVNGGDGCVLSFGHAGVGNANSMVGQDSGAQSLGIIPSAISWLFRLIQECKQRTGARFSIRVSAIEIAGPQEELRDLLVTYASSSVACTSTAAVCLKEDPIFGTQLQNACELRVPTAEKAAFYFDAALAARRANTEEERRNSHLFFTLHVYQYQVDKCGKGGVAGGRTRLHLIDLGSGEKNSKSGRTSLTLPALGNVLLTLLQGQKHLPSRDSKLTQILKDAIGSQACKSIAVITNVCPDQDRYMETINAVQIAGRLCRIRRTKKTRLGFNGSTSSGGESSCDERSGRRRLPRSASDPDCTTSSSEQSCDTVIFLGAGGAGNRTGMGTVSISDKELTDTESPSTSQRPPTLAKTQIPHVQPVMGTTRITTTREPPSPLVAAQNGTQQKGTNAVLRTSDPLGNYPLHWPGQADLSGKEQWVDGPSASKSFEYWIDAPKKKESFLDPLKHEFIKQWVFLQEQERRQEIKLDKIKSSSQCTSPRFAGYPLKHSPFLSPVQAEGDGDATSEHSMETGSEPMEVVETRDASLQTEERDIDIAMGSMSYSGSGEAGPSSYLWPNAPEPEIRFLEDIAEVEEENLSETRSHHSSLHDQIMDSLNYRNEAMANLDPNFFLDEPKSSMYTNRSSIEEHPLRILSKERMDTKSDSFSFTTENIENVSLPGTDQMDDDLPTDEELERAMQASLTSIRSHEILEKLKAESKSNAKPCGTVTENIPLMETFGKKPPSADKNSNPQVVIPTISVTVVQQRTEPEGVEKIVKKLESGLIKVSGTNTKDFNVEQTPAEITDITNKPKETTQSSLITEKLHHPTVPALPKQVQNEVTSKFSAAAAFCTSYSRSTTKEPTSLTPSKALVSSTKLKSPDKIESPSFGSLPRPSKLPSPAPSSVSGKTVSSQIQPPQKDVNNSKFKLKSLKESKLAKSSSSDKSKPLKVASGVTTNGNVSSSNASGEKEVKTQLNHNGRVTTETNNEKEKPQSKTTKLASGLRSPLISFLKSPTKSKKPTPTTSAPSPGQRSSVGYDSGHDSGIVTIESPELLASPYSKVTKPRQSQRSSSGHGSDNSSAVSSDAGVAGGRMLGPHGHKLKLSNGGSKLSLGFGNKSKNRESVGASSGYESAGGGVRESETTATSPESASDTENTVQSVPSYKVVRKKSWLEGFAAMSNTKSKSAPQSPSNVSLSSPHRMCDSQVVDRNEFKKHQQDLKCLKRKQKEVAELSQKQTTLQRELKEAKDRLGIPQTKWNYDLHVAKCTDLNQSDFLEALRQETKILEKRVIACKSHVMMVTVFDAVPPKKIL